MTLPLVYLREAEEEIAATFRQYENERPGLGGKFIVALKTTHANIAERPLSYALYWRNVRAALLSKFPYVVYFEIEPTRILVIAVQHGRRSGRSWKSRA